MDLHRLEVFCKVVDLKSFTKAAEAIFLSQPTVSEHIRSLEETLNEKLVDRLGREVLPTQAGQILYKYAKKILALRQEAIQAIQEYSGNLAGHLTVGASTIPGTYILPEIIGGFKKEFPATQLTLAIGNSRKVADGVLAGDTEIGIIGARLSEPALSWQEIFHDELVLAVYPDHPFAKKKSITPDQLIEQAIIIRERDSGTRKVMTQILEKHLDLAKLSIVAEMGSTEAVRQSIKSQIGIAILSQKAVAEDLRLGSLVSIPIKGVRLSRPFYLIQRKNRQTSPICKAFMANLNRQDTQKQGR